MALQKIEFYEGAALYRLIRALGDVRVRVDGGSFVLNERWRVYAKYSTRVRGPWTFTFTARERDTLADYASGLPLSIGLICGADGVAAMTFDDFCRVAGKPGSQASISCARRYNEHYAVGGPGGELERKVSPSFWSRMLVNEA